MAKLVGNGYDKNIGWNEIATNGLTVVFDRPVAIKAGFADVAVAGDRIVGISAENKTFAADNETNAKERLTFIGVDAVMKLRFKVVNGTITQANVGSLFDIDANGDVDAGAAGASQLRLVKVYGNGDGKFTVAK